MNTVPIQYVCCLVFTEDGQHVVLLKKNHGPEILLGKWNGPGGKIQGDETTNQAATREMGEETGVYVAVDKWRNFFNLVGPGYSVAFLTARTKAASSAKTIEEEEVLLWPVTNIMDKDRHASHEFCANIPWLILLALDETTVNTCGSSTN